MIRKVWYMILVLITIYLEIMYDSTWMLAMLAFEPVSYTHLTLPTICSV